MMNNDWILDLYVREYLLKNKTSCSYTNIDDNEAVDKQTKS